MNVACIADTSHITAKNLVSQVTLIPPVIAWAGGKLRRNH